jgi:hypothetical protein
MAAPGSFRVDHAQFPHHPGTIMLIATILAAFADNLPWMGAFGDV